MVSNTSVNDTTTILSTGTLPTVAGRQTDMGTINFTNTVAYRYYRLIFNTAVSGTVVQVSEIRLSGNTGTDTIQSSVSFTLPSNVENITLTGTANINATGNTQANVLNGNSGNNELDGGAGIDTMTGGLGDDTYYVDVAGDVVTEIAGEGTDTVYTAVNYTAVNVENIIATGNAITITGDATNNVLTSQGTGTTLRGLAGNDTYFVDDITDIVDESFAGSFWARSSLYFSGFYIVGQC